MRIFGAKNTISFKLISAILLASSIVTLFITAGQLAFDYLTDLNAIEKSFHLVGSSHVPAIENALWNYDIDLVTTQLVGVKNLPLIDYVELSTDKGKILATSGALPDGRTVANEVRLQYTFQGKTTYLGKIKVVSGINQLLEKLSRKVLLIFLMQFGKTLLVSFFIYLIIRKIVTQHLINITDFLKNFRLGEDKTDLKLDRRDVPLFIDHTEPDELDTLVSVINSMKNSLRNSFSQLKDWNLQLEARVEEKTQTILEQRQKMENTSRLTALGEMAGGIAHEINTPLSIITMSSDAAFELLENDELDKDEMKRYLSSILTTVTRISNLIRCLRYVARDAGRDPFDHHSVIALLKDAIELSQAKFKQANIRLFFDENQSDIEIDCRAVQISQVLLNLLNNAVDAIDDLKIDSKWVEIKIQDDADHVVISVIDCGSGIPTDIAEKIMQPFFTTKSVDKGTGLGLSISLGIIQEHNGSLSIDTNSPNTRFDIRLPKKHVDQQSIAA